MAMRHEPTVSISTPPPPGYHLVPKGNPYMTLNCRKQTQLSGKKVYNVVDKHKHPIGIRVPRSIYTSVLASFTATKDTRADAVRRRDSRLEDTYRDAIIASFPGIPRDRVPGIVGHAMKKHSGRVGRTGKLDAREKAVLGVLAHIRHVHSPYDKLLKDGVSRNEARRRVAANVQKKAREWRYSRAVKDSGGGGGGGGDAAKSRERPRAPQEKQQDCVRVDTTKANAEGPIVGKRKRKRKRAAKGGGKAARKRRKASNAPPSTIVLPVRGKNLIQPTPTTSSARAVRVTTRSMARTSRQDVSEQSIPDHISISSDDNEDVGPDGDSIVEGSSQDEFFWISSDDELTDKHDDYNEDDNEGDDEDDIEDDVEDNIKDDYDDSG